MERGLYPGNGDVQIVLGGDGAAVRGRVLMRDGAGVADATVFLVPKDSGRHLSAQTDQNGSFQIVSGVKPGEYRLAATTALMLSERHDPAMASRLAGCGIAVKLGPREDRSVDLKVSEM